MKVSTQAIKFLNEHYGSAGDPAADGVEALVEKIGAQLGAVEEVIDFGKKFEGVIIVKVVSCDQHPNADRLHVCKVDDGGKAQNVERDENGHVQVVCGAPNVHAGMLAAWLPPGSTVPSTAGKEPFVLEARELRGVVSNGMMASPKELTLGDNHEGILEITEDFGPVAPGTMFADQYRLRDDVVIDIENKMFTHRPDCFGYLGVAREIEGINHRRYKSPDWYKQNPELPGVETEELKLEVKNEIPQLVPRFTAIALRNVEVKPSPVWIQVELARAGLRSINNIVDYTNYFMLLTGQPLHAYDYDKLLAVQAQGQEGAQLGVRHPRSGEKLKLLNGKEIEPRAEAILITAGDVPVGIGGVMGGADTEVDENTSNIILESASFDMYSIRRTSMAHGLFTDAVTRFNKGQSPLQCLAALAKITDEIRQYAGGKVASPLADDNHVPQDAQERGNIHPPVTLSGQFVNERLGWNLSAEEMKTLLENVEFKVQVESDGQDRRQTTDDKQLTVHAPFWRTDIETPEDIVEEIGRLNGYDKLPLDLPGRDLTPAAKNPILEVRSQIRQALSAAGANEVLNYSFVHGNLFQKTGQDSEQAFRLSNALSPDLQYFRLSLTPSLLEKVHPNVKAGHDRFVIYELGKAHNKKEQDEEGLPREVAYLALVFAASDRVAGDLSGAPYYQARKYLTHLLQSFGADSHVRLEPLAVADLGRNPWIEQMTAPYEPNRSAVMRDPSGAIWGVVGEFRASVRKSLKLPDAAAGFEVDPLLFVLPRTGKTYAQLPKFPSVTQDICLKVPANLAYAELFRFAEEHLRQNRPDQTHHTLEPVDIYQREDDPDHKQITLRLSIASYERTLTDQEVNALLDQVADSAKEKLAAERV